MTVLENVAIAAGSIDLGRALVAISPLIAILSLSISFWSFVIKRRADEDQALLGQLILTLERAFSTLGTDGATLPNRDRLAWLTCARHLKSYGRLKCRLRTSLCKLLCEEHEEHWRHRFYVLLGAIDSPRYFSSINLGEMRDENISPTSAAIILAFSAWPDDKQDTVDEAEFSAIVKKAQLFSAQYRHFRSYIAEHFPKAFAEAEYRQ